MVNRPISGATSPMPGRSRSSGAIQNARSFTQHKSSRSHKQSAAERALNHTKPKARATAEHVFQSANQYLAEIILCHVIVFVASKICNHRSDAWPIQLVRGLSYVAHRFP